MKKNVPKNIKIYHVLGIFKSKIYVVISFNYSVKVEVLALVIDARF